MTELVANGTFDSDTSGWAAVNASLSVVAGRLRVTTTDAKNGWGYQAVPTEVGSAYRFRFDTFGRTAPGLSFVIATGAGSASLAKSTVAGVNQSLVYTATTTTTYVRCQAMTSNVGDYAEFDNISVQKLPPRKAARSSWIVG